MLAWGAAYVPSAWLVETWPPILAAGARLTLAGVLLLALLAMLGRPLRPGVGPSMVGWLALTQTTLFYGAVF
jgi:drug/metabolite transporter (DMT)-like permease